VRTPTTTTAAERSIAAYLAERRAEIDSELDRLVPAESRWPATLHRAIRHSLFAGGKRLRPILCLAAAEALGASPDEVLAPACGLELIHTYSLVHDDLPAMDDAPLRRGAPTSHVRFGEAVAILAGDALLTEGLAVLARHPGAERYAAAKLSVLDVVTRAIGSEGMIGGQVADLEASPKGGEDELLAIHEAKTGRLIRAALVAGGLYAFAPEEALARLDACGRALGLAFQIRDDLLDVESDAATLGKEPGSDSAAEKLTFPAVWGIERSRTILEEKVEEAASAALGLPGGGGRLPELARFVRDRRS
jgi:geranylgeranyl diphosphate synthase type II